MIDPYLDPESGVLRNHLGLTDRGLLSEFEDDISTAAMSVLRSGPLPGRYDLVHLQAFHRRIFGRVYPWAGEIRTVAIAKTDMFCLPQHIEPYATEVFGRLAAEGHLRRLDRKPFVERLTHYFAEVNAIHPFREGNGRTQRAFFGQLSSEAGWPIRWLGLDPEANIEASIASLRGDNAPLRTLLDGLVTPEEG
jgi:cell filamentation protein, protein adenylyltransferase